MISCVVVIPVHTPKPSPYELISFRQCFSVLKRHAIRVIAPKGLSLEKYRQVVPDFEVVTIDPKWQSSVAQYNRLKISRFFYRIFDSYDYLLTYELDAFVFKDELNHWCQQGYDYMGAPWWENYTTSNPGNKLLK